MPRSKSERRVGEGASPAALGLAASGAAQPSGSAYLNAGLRTARAVASASGPAEAYKLLLPVLCPELGGAVARLWLSDSGGEQIVCVDWWWSEPRFRAAAEPPFGITCTPGVGLAGTCWLEGEPMVLPIGERPELFPNQGLLAESGIRTASAVPLTGVAEVIGVLTLYFATAARPSRAELAQLYLVGEAVGPVIEAKQQDAAAREQLRRDQLLLSTTSAVAAAGSYQETLRMLAASSVPWMGDLCLIDLVTTDGGLERVAAVHADPSKAALVDELRRYYAPRIDSSHPAGKVTTTGISAWSAEMPDSFLQDTTRNRRHFEIVKALGFTSYLSVPLRAGDELLGAITLISAGSGRVFGADDVATGERLAAQVAGTIARARELDREQRRSAESQARDQALLELGVELTGAQAVDDVLAALLRSPACSLGADIARIALLDESRTRLELTFAGTADPELSSRYHVLGMDAPLPIVEVVRDRRAVLIGDTGQLPRRYQPLIAETSEQLRAIALEPLRAEDGSALGALGLSWRQPREFTPDEVELLLAVSAATSRAIARILVARREHEVAASLQERLLALAPALPAAVVAAVYRPAGEAMRVGGDWYTARMLDDSSRLAVSVGDVVGHGLDAVATMSQLRSALDLAALGERDPGDVLALLDRYAQDVPGASCATAAFARVDAATGRVHYACAGHPYPVVVAPDGAVTLLTDGRRAPLGIQPADAAVTGGVAELAAGSLLVLYSDGLIERHGESLQAGLERLADAARGCRQLPVHRVCAHLLARLISAEGYSDDVVVVALRPVGNTVDCHVDCLAASEREIPAARHRLRAWLAGLGLSPELSWDLLLAAGEAVNNAIEHASHRDPRRYVALEAFADRDRIVLSVTDSGRWSKDSAASRRGDGRGWGLALIHGLSHSVDTTRGPLGTSVTMTFRRDRGGAPDRTGGVSRD